MLLFCQGCVVNTAFVGCEERIRESKREMCEKLVKGNCLVEVK